MAVRLKCRLEWRVNAVSRRYEKSELHVFFRTNNRCQCGHQRWEKRTQVDKEVNVDRNDNGPGTYLPAGS